MRKVRVELRDCFKRYTYDQDKAYTPLETVKRFRERLEEAKLDILKEVRRIDNGRLDIPVYFSVCGQDARKIIGAKKQMGKGSTPEQSQASACMELAERFSFFSFKKETQNFVTETYANLKAKGERVMSLEMLLRSVHDEKTDKELAERLLANIPIQWTWATNLTRGEEVLIPFSWFYAINEFNGPSAGNTYEEAVIQGICEIVERHVSAVVSHDKIITPAIDLGSVINPVARELISKFTKNGIHLYLNDFSLDTGIPTVGALAVDLSTFPDLSEIVFTAGTTPNSDKALIRALTEVAQLAGDFNTKANYVASGLPKPLNMEEVSYITATETAISMGEMADLSHDNLKVEIENCLLALKRRGMEVFIVNTTHPKLQIPAFYTIIPGAHFRERSRVSNVGLFAAKLLAELIPDPDESSRRLLKIAALLPEAYFIQFYLGRNLLNKNEPSQALQYFEKALDLNPEEEDLPYIYSYIGCCYKDLGKYEDAISILKKAESLDPERTDVYNLLGFCHFKLKDHETAIRHFGRVIELNPSSAIDYANIGVNYRELGRTREAIRYFELAVSLDPSIEFARENLQNLLQPPSRFEESAS